MSGLSGCKSDTTETVEECIERFVNTQNDMMRLRGGEWQPIFTYDIGQAKEFTDKLMASSPVLEAFGMGGGGSSIPPPSGRSSYHCMRISHGPTTLSLSRFVECQ